MRYVVIHKSFTEPGGPSVTFDDPKEAQAVWGRQYAVYELGPEVKEPDYGPLVEWVSAWRRRLHHMDCPHSSVILSVEDVRCTCGLANALDKAGLA